MPTSLERSADTFSLWQRAQTILAKALDLPASERDALLNDSCKSDPSLREYVDMFLAKNDAIDDWIEQSAVQPLNVQLLHTNNILANRFEVIRLLGRGGMSEVYEVLDGFSSERQALKVLLPELSDHQEIVLRIKQEIQLARRVSHVNVCRIHEVFRDENEGRHPRVLHFFTMELLEGNTLAEHLQAEGPLSPAEAFELLEMVGEGLAAAHAAGVVHRDLKPSNIMLVPRDGGIKRVVITDFGMAVPASQDTPRHVARGRLIGGTPRYMAPEQFETDVASPATDVFALGVIVHEMLTGCTPFTASRMTELLKQTSEPPRVSGQLHAGIPANWARALVRCFEPRPENRFASVDEFVAALRPRGPLLRRSLLAAAGLTAVILVYPRWWPSESPEPGTRSEPAMAAFSRASLQGKRLTTDELFKSIRNYEEAVRADPSFAEAHAGLAECYGRLQDYGGMPFKDAGSKAQASARQAIRLKPKLPQAHAALGLSLSLDVDRWREAEASFRTALDLKPGYASAHHWLGVHLARTGRTSDAVAQLRLALRSDPASLPVANALGWMLYFDRQYEASIKAALGTIDLDPNYFYSHLLLARCHAELQQYAQALKMCEVARVLSARGPLGAPQPVPSVVTSATACIFAASGSREKSRQELQVLLKQRQSSYVPAHYVATVYCELDDIAPALDLLERALSERDPGVLYIRLYPQFRVLRSEPRYRTLVSALGFPAEERAGATGRTATG